MGDSSRSVTSICGPCEYITPIGVRSPHNPLSYGSLPIQHFKRIYKRQNVATNNGNVPTWRLALAN